MPKRTPPKYTGTAKKPKSLLAFGVACVFLTLGLVNLLRSGYRIWQEGHFTVSALLPTADWHSWFTLPVVLLSITLAGLSVCAYFWWILYAVRAKRRLAEQQALVTPTEGVWPPPPRME